jgi:hypothetical protein
MRESTCVGISTVPWNRARLRLAGSPKRHYTFARRGRRMGPPASPRRSNPQCKTLILRGFCSLRLSVRTPPFHGGESGSIPLGSANPFKYLAVRPRFASNICPIYSCEIGHVRRSPRSALSFVGAAAEQSHHRSQSLPDFQDGTPNCRRCGRPREDHQVWCALLPAVRPGLLIGARPPHLRRDVPAKFCGLVPPIRAGGI